MSTKPHQRVVAGTISNHYADKLQTIARARGFSSLHAFVSRVLTGLAKNTSLPAPGELPPSDGNVNRLTQTLTVEILLPLAQRLHSAARQMRDGTDEPVQPTELVRMLLVHECERPTNVVQQIAEQVDPAYVDIVPFTGKTFTRSGYAWHTLRIKCSTDTEKAIALARSERGVTLASLVRDVLDAHLPELPQ